MNGNVIKAGQCGRTAGSSETPGSDVQIRVGSGGADAGAGSDALSSSLVEERFPPGRIIDLVGRISSNGRGDRQQPARFGGSALHGALVQDEVWSGLSLLRRRMIETRRTFMPTE